MENANTEILSENYGNSPSLNILSTKYYNENPSVEKQVAAAASSELKLELKSTEAVRDFYCILLE